MRVISGYLGGRNFDAPKGKATHPMSDKMRGALFNMLGDISDLTVLDAFAGSGALSFEAVSRGAAAATAIENDKTAHKVINDNAKALDIDKEVKAIKATVSGWSANNPAAIYDLVLADPPYENLQESSILKLTQHLKPNSLMVLSWPGHKKAPAFSGLIKQTERNYGDSQLVFYRKNS